MRETIRCKTCNLEHWEVALVSSFVKEGVDLPTRRNFSYTYPPNENTVKWRLRQCQVLGTQMEFDSITMVPKYEGCQTHFLLCHFQENRYASDKDSDGDTFFDWYQDYSTLKQHIAPYLKLAGKRLANASSSSIGISKDIEILIPGCGNSSKYRLFCMSWHESFTILGNILNRTFITTYWELNGRRIIEFVIDLCSAACWPPAVYYK